MKALPRSASFLSPSVFAPQHRVMPTYEYRCPDGHDFEHFFRSISGAKSEMPCPVCAQSSTRLISLGAGLHFKGSGFYITDYGKDGKKDQRERPSGVTSKGDGATSRAEGSGSGGGTGDAGSAPAKSGEGPSAGGGASGGSSSGGSGAGGSSSGGAGSGGSSSGGSGAGGSSSGGSSSGGSGGGSGNSGGSSTGGSSGSGSKE